MNVQRLNLCGCRAVAVALFCALGLCGGFLRAENGLDVGSGRASVGEIADVPLLLSGDGDVQGFVMVFEWDTSHARGVDLVPNDGAGQPLNGADLIEKRVQDGFMIFAVVMDIDGTGGEKIPAGQDINVGTAKIRCPGPTEGTVETPIRLVDNKYARVDGGPTLSNLVSIGGRSIGKGEGLVLSNGSVICEGEDEPDDDVVFTCGGTLDGDGDPRDQKGPRGSRHQVDFYYRSPGNGPGQSGKIQGFSMSVAFNCNLTLHPDSFDLTGGALEQAGAEFVHIETDNLNPTVDGDACEFTLGVLIDAVPPFDGRALPSTSRFRKLFSIDFEIEDDATCGQCLWIKFMDGLTGTGGIPPVRNLVSIDFQSRSPETINCSVCVDADSPKFIRGDCNFSNRGNLSVDIADAAAAVGYIFLTGNAKFNAPCDDACDANDDGRLDAADVVFILHYLFIPRSPRPPAPGPTSAGSDPTQDNLGCNGGRGDC